MAAAAVGNGLRSFSIHAYDETSRKEFDALAADRNSHRAFGLAASPTNTVDPETAARRYLDHALASDQAPDFVAPKAGTTDSQFKVIGTQAVPLTQTTTVKFRQAFHDIPVYGSLITVELDKSNDLLGINSSLGTPSGVSPVATISPQAAAQAVVNEGPYKKQIDNIAPRLNFYFDVNRSQWCLAFIFEDVPVRLPREDGAKSEAVSPRYFDYVVDAHSGKVIAELPRTSSITSAVQNAKDALGVDRNVSVVIDASRAILKDLARNVQTFDFSYQDPDVDEQALPGTEVSSPWPAEAVGAHANTAEVADFLRTVLMRNNIDNQGGPMNSSVNCVVASESDGHNEWLNAYWNGKQMVYGQVLRGNGLVSLSAALDIVGHEMFHGVTDSTSRLEYVGQSGALNESYSDIFGLLIANRSKPDVQHWDWKVGQGFGEHGAPFRDMSNPPAQGQPDHMNNFADLPHTRQGDWGGVHTNSGIHNKAAYNVFTATDANGPVFKTDEVAAIFYYAVTELLSRTSQFADSRQAVLNAARTVLRALPPNELKRKISAIEKAYDQVGIT